MDAGRILITGIFIGIIELKQLDTFAYTFTTKETAQLLAYTCNHVQYCEVNNKHKQAEVQLC